MGSSYGRVIGRLFAIDPLEEFQEMEKYLEGIRRPAHTLSYGELADELEQVENNAWRAARLLAHAQDARDAYERDCAVQEGAWKEKAVAALEQAKKDNELTKRITIGDVDSYIATHFVTEYKELSDRRSKAKRMVEAIERGADLLKKRRETLDTLTKGAR
jgi:hypothetical protein